MFRSVWRIQWTGLLGDSVMFLILVSLGALGIRYISPWIIMLAGFALSVAIYRIRYKRF
jgi:hypothetical protein